MVGGIDLVANSIGDEEIFGQAYQVHTRIPQAIKLGRGNDATHSLLQSGDFKRPAHRKAFRKLSERPAHRKAFRKLSAMGTGWPPSRSTKTATNFPLLISSLAGIL